MAILYNSKDRIIKMLNDTTNRKDALDIYLKYHRILKNDDAFKIAVNKKQNEFLFNENLVIINKSDLPIDYYNTKIKENTIIDNHKGIILYSDSKSDIEIAKKIIDIYIQKEFEIILLMSVREATVDILYKKHPSFKPKEYVIDHKINPIIPEDCQDYYTTNFYLLELSKDLKIQKHRICNLH